jgi:hypothetical protein
MDEDCVVLWRPVGPQELELIRRSGMREFPPRLPEQPIFYPVLSEEYAIKIARDWNVPASGRGYVTRFRVRKSRGIPLTTGAADHAADCAPSLLRGGKRDRSSITS